MCIIIDANVAQECCVLSEDARPVMNSVANGELKIVSGHKLRKELLSCTFRKVYKQLLLAGKVVEFADGEIRRELGRIKKHVCSNDGHIIAWLGYPVHVSYFLEILICIRISKIPD